MGKSKKVVISCIIKNRIDFIDICTGTGCPKKCSQDFLLDSFYNFFKENHFVFINPKILFRTPCRIKIWLFQKEATATGNDPKSAALTTLGLAMGAKVYSHSQCIPFCIVQCQKIQP